MQYWLACRNGHNADNVDDLIFDINCFVITLIYYESPLVVLIVFTLMTCSQFTFLHQGTHLLFICFVIVFQLPNQCITSYLLHCHVVLINLFHADVSQVKQFIDECLQSGGMLFHTHYLI